MPAEFASKISHIEIINDPFIQNLLEELEITDISEIENNSTWKGYTSDVPLTSIYSVDGSYQIITSRQWPYRKLAFVKISMVKLDNQEISYLDKENPHPMKIRDILSKSSVYYATILPLQHIKQKGMNAIDTIRHIIFKSMKNSQFGGEILETLKWIVYEKWDETEKDIPAFNCPHCCKDVATLSYDTEVGTCVKCGKPLFITDMLGFHQEMSHESAQEVIVGSYMNIFETLALFMCIKYFWEKKRDVLDRSLFIKDGPLTIRAQYSKLVSPIRRFLEFANKEHTIYLTSQEKSGRFVDHLKMIEGNAPNNSVFIPNDNYIKVEIQQRSKEGQQYGRDTNYGSKIFVKINEHHSMVLNIPTGKFKPDPEYNDLIGVDRIIETVTSVLSSKHESGIIPIEMAHNIASLSTYPSAKILELLAEEARLM